MAVPIVCRETTAELLRVLTYPKLKLTPTERDVLLAEDPSRRPLSYRKRSQCFR